MSRKLLSALALVAAGSIIVCWGKYFGNKEQILDRQIVKNVLITLRKRFFSTLREISFAIQQMKSKQDFSETKISQVIIKNGHNAQIKLNALQEYVLKHYNIKNSNSLNKQGSLFENSCSYYADKDIQIKILMQNLKIDIEMAMQGTFQSQFIGKLPSVSANQTFEIYKKVIQRRMETMQKNLNQNQNINQMNLLNSQAQVQYLSQKREQFLAMNGIKDDKQPNQKLLLALIEYYYSNDSFFRLQIEQLQNGLEQAINQGNIKQFFEKK